MNDEALKKHPIVAHPAILTGSPGEEEQATANAAAIEAQLEATLALTEPSEATAKALRECACELNRLLIAYPHSARWNFLQASLIRAKAISLFGLEASLVLVGSKTWEPI